ALSVSLALLFHPRRPRSPLFPTRRSSDLVDEAGRVIDEGAIGLHGGRGQARGRLAVAGAVARVGLRPQRGEERSAGQGVEVALRSEEHTSELQSRENLVCRLHLEKTKQ